MLYMCYMYIYRIDVPGGSDSKASSCNGGDLGSITGLRNPLGNEITTHSMSEIWPEKFHELKSLVGYIPWGHKESDMTEQLYFHM